jgi:hypothetical protein
MTYGISPDPNPHSVNNKSKNDREYSGVSFSLAEKIMAAAAASEVTELGSDAMPYLFTVRLAIPSDEDVHPLTDPDIHNNCVDLYCFCHLNYLLYI